MKQLVKIIKLYSDGSYKEEVFNSSIESTQKNEISEILINDVDIKIKEILANEDLSKRIAINLAILLKIKINYLHMDLKRAINSAITQISRLEGVSRSTVADKIGRQLNLSSKQYREIIKEMLNGNVSPIVNHLTKFLGRDTVEADLRAIEKFFHEL
ncbi:hypothetical protein [Phosphitispora fastidiosa]|uniref:hypothetical protein n=1 Tax=Phosphitispora fastidiosa TaxID=2837202 RepID=UPI001E30DD50|nr:hypothetical protein [Phosphitispora fastidiosa]MBU7006593.1 anthranilate phosphoribosyltransferase [Phosphitispora fastidiosa]